MKRCPTCNQTFEEEWLSFCTQDGTTLIDDQAGASDALPTIVAPAPNPVSTQLPSAHQNMQAQVAPVFADNLSPQPAAWQPPPPPSYLQPQSKGMATAAMIIGIASMACLGPIPGIVAIVLGAMTLSQIKKNPDTVGGKQQAVTGIVTGSLAVLIYGGLMLVYVVMILFAASGR